MSKTVIRHKWKIIGFLLIVLTICSERFLYNQYTGSSLGTVLQTIVTMAFLFYSGLAIVSYNIKNSTIKSFALLLVLVLSWAIIEIYSNHYNTTAIKTAVVTLSSPISAYYIAKKDNLPLKLMRYFLMGLFFILIGKYFVMESVNAFLFSNDKIPGGGYIIVPLLPWVVLLFWDKPKILFPLFAIAGALILIAAKRGAIVCLALSCLVFIFYYLKSKKSIISWMFIIMLLIGGYYYTAHLLETSDRFAYKFYQTEKGDSSGRNELYEDQWNYFWEQELHNQLLGKGTEGATQAVGIPAHNDWLEIMQDYGFIGIIIYLVSIVTYANFCRKIRYKSARIRCSAFIILVCWGSSSLFSMFLFSLANIPMLVLLGFILGQKEYLANFSNQVGQYSFLNQ